MKESRTSCCKSSKKVNCRGKKKKCYKVEISGFDIYVLLQSENMFLDSYSHIHITSTRQDPLSSAYGTSALQKNAQI